MNIAIVMIAVVTTAAVAIVVTIAVVTTAAVAIVVTIAVVTTAAVAIVTIAVVMEGFHAICCKHGGAGLLCGAAAAGQVVRP